MASVSGDTSREHRPLIDPIGDQRLRKLQQCLADHGVNQQSARDATANNFYNWSLTDIERVFSKLTTSDPDLKSLEAGWLNSFLDIIADGTTSELYWTKPPAALVERSAREGLALCVNKDGRFDLRNGAYFCISHVWEEGICADADQNRGIPTHRIKQIFQRISHIRIEWIWLDGLAIPSGSRSLTFKEEEQKTAIINSLADIYEKSEAVIVFDALTMHLRSSDPIETAMVLTCGKWMNRVWTWQEVKISRKAIVLTATSTVDWGAMFERLRIQASVGPRPQLQRGVRDTTADRKFYDLFMTIARLTRVDEVGLSLADIAMASKTRQTGNDIDYARAYFPALRLKWKTGMSREEAMSVIFESRRKEATCLVLMHGSPRTSFFPGWAPSYLKGLVGPVLKPSAYESRGIRRSWHTVKVKEQIPIEKPRALLLTLESLAEQAPRCGCLLGEGESQATLDGIRKAIDAGTAYILSAEPLYPIAGWAKQALLVERVKLDQDDEAYVYLTVEVTVLQENAISWEPTWLLRHESPISEHLLSGKLISELRVSLGQGYTYGEHKMIDAAHNGDEETVKSLMSNRSQVSDRNEKGWTALHAASVAGKLNIVRILLREPIQFNTNANDNVFRTPLMFAVENGYDDVVDLLIDRGADPNYQHRESLMSVLDQAIKHNRSSTLHLLLLKGANPNQPNTMGMTPLVSAFESPDMLRILLAHDADPSIITSLGITALHWAARGGVVDAIEQLLDHGMDPNMREAGSRCDPLYRAVDEQEEGAVALLLRRRANPNAVYDDDWTPLMMACKKGYLSICQALVKAGARTSGREKCKPEGWTALHIAAMGKSNPMASGRSSIHSQRHDLG